MEDSEKQGILVLASANFHRLLFTSTTYRLCLQAPVASMEASIVSTASAEPSIEAASANINGRSHGSVHGASQAAFFKACTTSIGACFASIKASWSLHRFRGSFYPQRHPFPYAIEASVEAIEASMEAEESFHSLRDRKLPRMLTVEAFLWKLPWKIPGALLQKRPRSCFHFRRCPCGSTYIHWRPLRPMNFDTC